MIWNEIVQLVRKAQAGDKAAYGELVQRFEAAVFGIAVSRLRNEAEAQELTQEVFIHVMSKLDQLRDAHCFAGWLRQITVRMAINRLTRNAPRLGSGSDALVSAPAETETPLEEMVRAENRAKVLAGLQELKELDRQTLEAFYLRGHSLKRMARDFETPVGTIKRRLHVARNRLRERLARSPKHANRGRHNREELACV